MTPDETRRLAASGAVAGLCPTTEANLGDGTFRASDYLSNGGICGVGTDSNIQIDAVAELRQLEYSQRLNYLACDWQCDCWRRNRGRGRPPSAT